MNFVKLSFLSFLIFIISLSSIALSENNALPVKQLYSSRVGNSWGYVDGNNNVVIPAFFEDAEDFSEGLGQVKIGNKWGFVNDSGKMVIPPIYEASKPFMNGVSAVSNGDKWGYIEPDGKIKINFIYETAGDFHEGLAAVSETGKKDSFGFINKDGKFVIPRGVYDDAKIFSEGVAPVENNDKWGFINKDGKIVIPLVYEDAQIFSKGLAAVRFNKKWGYINKEGQTAIDFNYDYASAFTNDGALVSEDGDSYTLGYEALPLLPSATALSLKPYPHPKPKPKPSIDYPNWMKHVRDNALVYCLDMPGTHDSATYKADMGSYWSCQSKDMNIFAQLNWGIRVLDIRLKMTKGFDARGFRNLLTAHGNHTYDSFGVILNQCIKFLQQHPNETIVMIIANEESPDFNAKDFNDSVDWYLKEACRENNFGDWKERFPDTSNGKLWRFTMKDARQKILLATHGVDLSRAMGIPWGRFFNKDGVNIRIADEWGEKHKPSWEWPGIKKESFEKVKIRKNDYGNKNLLIQFLSGSWTYTPLFVAGTLVPWFASIFPYNNYGINYQKDYRLGWFMMDYINYHFFPQLNNLRDRIIEDSSNNPRGLVSIVSIPDGIIVDNPNPMPNTLYTNFKLENSHAIVSSGEKPRYGLIMQPDNNLVLYYFTEWDKNNKGKSGFPIWATGTFGKGTQGKGYADLQSDFDGNFVVYTERNRKNPLWSSGTNSKGDAITLKDNGTLVIYKDGFKPNDQLWVSEN